MTTTKAKTPRWFAWFPCGSARQLFGFDNRLVAKQEEALTWLGFPSHDNSQRQPNENRQDAQNHCLLREQVEASHASSQKNQRQRKLDLVSHDVRDL
jgi:glutathione peroxidase-family protein